MKQNSAQKPSHGMPELPADPRFHQHRTPGPGIAPSSVPPIFGPPGPRPAPQMYSVPLDMHSPAMYPATGRHTIQPIGFPIGHAPHHQPPLIPPAPLHSLPNATPTGPPSTAESKRERPSEPILRHHKRPTRALRACVSCRKQKTRCFPASSGEACFRCQTLDLACSFVSEPIRLAAQPAQSDSPALSGVAGTEKTSEDATIGSLRPRNRPRKPMKPLGLGNSTDARIRQIQADVAELLQLARARHEVLSPGNYGISAPNSGKVGSASYSDPNSDLNNFGTSRYPGKQGTFGTSATSSPSNPSNPSNPASPSNPAFGPFGSAKPSTAFAAAAYTTAGQLLPTASLPLPLARLLAPPTPQPAQDVISLGILPHSEAVRLVQQFRDRYGRWVSFPDTVPSTELVDRFSRKCPLLLAVCCALALRYSQPELKKHVYPRLLQTLHTGLAQALLEVPQSFEFVQAVVLLSVYGVSLSGGTFVIDAWFLSGVALQHFVTRDARGAEDGETPLGSDAEFSELTALRMWNHLCLTHLLNCVLSGRMCIVDEIRLDRTRSSLELPTATNFDGRMVSEIALQLIVYNFVQTDQSLPVVRAELQLWLEEWKYLFEQPTTQFVELGYHFGNLAILYHWSFRQRNARTQGSPGHPGSLQEILGYPGLVEEVLRAAGSAALRSMVYHAQKVLDAALEVPGDSYFAFLSDQLHFCICYAGLMMCRVLWVVGEAETAEGRAEGAVAEADAGARADVDAGQSTNESGEEVDVGREREAEMGAEAEGETEAEVPFVSDLDVIELSEKETHRLLQKVYDIGKRLGKVATTDTDVVALYSRSLLDAIANLFPQFTAQEVVDRDE